uniref:Uncharacterized protein n=1 Tax=Siphoviridae sp. ctPrm3 TaxID=2827864 RepID=A0A8S5TPB2_9CAUD|nr:MAG TPA: hypothetical protein [Siphoviridae sp. ctPrm3]
MRRGSLVRVPRRGALDHQRGRLRQLVLRGLGQP